ncbi:MAG: hypothetical protein ACK5HR_01250, partial [Mycoplasmatales bacterium]
MKILKVGILRKILLAVILLIISLIISMLTYYAQTNVFTNEAPTKVEAIELVKAQDISQSYTQTVSDFQGTFVKDTSYAITLNDKEYYGQGYYITYVPDNDLVFCLQLNKTATKLVGNINEEGNNFYSTLDTKTQEEVQKVILSTKDLYDETQNPEYLASGQIMLWSLFGELNYTTDVVEAKIAEIQTNESKFEDLSAAKIEYYQTLGQDLIDVTLDKVPTKSLEVEKEVDKKEVQPGETLQYKVTVKNEGTEPLTNIEVVDDIDMAEFDLTSLSDIKTTKGETILEESLIKWQINELAVEEEAILTFKIKVNEDLTNITTIYNSVVSCADDTECSNDSIEVTPNLNKELTVTKEADKKEIKPGENIHYIIKVANTGNVPLANVIIEDTLTDENLDKNSVNDLSVKDQDSNELNLNVDYLINEDKTITIKQIDSSNYITVEFDINAVDKFEEDNNIKNSAKACYDTDEKSCSEDEVEIKTLVPNMEVTKEASTNKAEPGDTITYTLVVKNTGETILEDIEVKDSIDDPNLDALSIDNLTPTLGKVTIDDGIITWNIPSLEISQEVKLTFDVTISKDVDVDTKIIANKVEACNEYNECEDDTKEINVVVKPDLTIKKTSDKTIIFPGDNIEYTIRVTNTGNTVLHNIEIIDPLTDANLDATSVKNIILTNAEKNILSEDSDYQIDYINKTIYLNALKIDEYVDITFNIKAADVFVPGTDSSTSIVNVAQATYQDANTSETIVVEDDNEVNTLTPDVEITKKADVNKIKPGQTIKYTINVKNTGETDLTDVEVVDPITDKTLDVTSINKLNASKGKVENNEGTILWTIDKLSINEEAQLTFEINVQEELTEVDDINNTAEVCSDNTACKTAEEEVKLDVKPGLKVTKEADKAAVEPGQSIHYKIKVANTGNILLPNVVVQDTLPTTNLDVTSLKNLVLTDQDSTILIKDTDYTVNDDQTITINKLAKDGNVTVEFDIKAANPFANDDTIINTAQACYNETESSCATGEVGVEPLIPNMEVEKTANVKEAKTNKMELGKTKVEPGQTIKYQIVVKNTGETNLKNIVVTDTIIDSNLDITTIDKITPSIGTASNKEGTITWEIPELLLGKEATLTFEIKVKEELTEIKEENTIQNKVEVSADNVADKDDEVDIKLDIKPGLEVTKEADKVAVEPGQGIHYKIKVANTGNILLPNVVVQDTLPTTNLDVTSLKNLVLTDQDSTILIKDTDYTVNDDQTITINKLAKGGNVTVEFDINAANPFANDDTIINTAQACYNETESSCATGEVGVEPLVPNFKITKEDNKGKINPAKPGDKLTYTMKVTNTGETKLTSIAVTDIFTEEQLKYYDLASIEVNNSGSFNEETNTITWVIDSLDINATKELTFEVQVNHEVIDGDMIFNTACARHENMETQCDGVKTPIKATSDVAIEKTATSAEVQAGDTIQYVLKIVNTGETNLHDVTVSDPLNDEYLDVSTIEGSIKVTKELVNKTEVDLTNNDDYQVDKKERTLTINDLEYGEMATITFEIQSKKEILNHTVITNVAEVCTSLVDKCSKDSAKVTVLNAKVQIKKTSNISKEEDVQTPGFISPGEEIIYTITVRNIGNSDLENLIVTDTFTEEQLKYYDLASIEVNNSGSFNEETNTMSWKIDNLNKGESQTLTFKVMANRDVVNGATITNKACVNSDIIAENCDDITDTIEAISNTSIEKSTSTGIVQAGDEIEYNLEVTNTGETNLHNLTITDELPEELVVSKLSPDKVRVMIGDNALISGKDYTVTLEERTLTIVLNDLNYTEDATITFTIPTSRDLEVGTKFTNKASACLDIETDYCTDDAEVEIGEVALKVDKTVDKKTAEVGVGDLTYTISIENTGNMNAENVYLSDNIDDEFYKVGETKDSVEQGRGNLDGSTLNLKSIKYERSNLITNYEILTPSETKNSDYAVHFAEVPAGKTYTVTYKIDQVSWKNGPTYGNKNDITLTERFDDYLINNTVTGYYDSDKDNDIDEVGFKKVKTKLAAVYVRNSFGVIIAGDPMGAGSIYLYNIGLTKIESKVLLNSANEGPTIGESNDKALLPGGMNKKTVSTGKSDKVGYISSVESITYYDPQEKEFKNFENYDNDEIGINDSSIPKYNDTFGTEKTKLNS